MLNVYRNNTLQWVQTSFLEDYNFDLVAGTNRLLTYRLAKPLRFETVIEGATERLTIAPRRGGWAVTGRDGRTVATVSGLMGRKGSLTTAGGTTYEWASLNFWGTCRSFRVKGGAEVLSAQSATWALKANAALTFGPARVSEGDLMLLCGLAIHTMVIERYLATLMILLASFGVLLV